MKKLILRWPSNRLYDGEQALYISDDMDYSAHVYNTRFTKWRTPSETFRLAKQYIKKRIKP